MQHPQQALIPEAPQSEDTPNAFLACCCDSRHELEDFYELLPHVYAILCMMGQKRATSNRRNILNVSEGVDKFLHCTALAGNQNRYPWSSPL